MSIVLEVGGERIEVDTEAQARKALRKATLAQKKLEAARQVNRDLARLRTRAVGYAVLEVKAGNRNFGRAWWFYTAEEDRVNHLCSPVGDVPSLIEYRVQTGDGAANFDFGTRRVVGVVTNGTGYVQLVVLQARDDDKPSFWSVGVAGDQWCCEPCSGLSIDDFNSHAKRSAQEVMRHEDRS